MLPILFYQQMVSVATLFFLIECFTDKTVKLWKISERERKVAEDAWNIPRHDRGRFGGSLQIPSIVPMELIVEASPRRVYGNAHTYHVNSISVNSDQVGTLVAFCIAFSFRCFIYMKKKSCLGDLPLG